MTQELKAFKLGSVEHGEYWAYDAEDVDAVLAEKDAVIAELKAQKAQAEDDCAYWKTMAQKNADDNAVMAKQRAEAFERERHHKYKRCLAMAKWCESENYTACWYHENSERCEWTEKWHKRWLKLAEKFKHNNSTAQQGKGTTKWNTSK